MLKRKNKPDLLPKKTLLRKQNGSRKKKRKRDKKHCRNSLRKLKRLKMQKWND